MEIYKVHCTSEPQRYYYYFPVGEQVSLPEYAKLFTENHLAYLRASRPAYGPVRAPNALDSFRKAIRSQGGFVELHEDVAMRLIEQFSISPIHLLLEFAAEAA